MSSATVDSSLGEDFILLSGISNRDYLASLDVAAMGAPSQPVVRQLADNVSIIVRQCRGFQQKLGHQRGLMVSLEQSIRLQLQELDERERRLDAEIKQFAGQERARLEMLAEMQRLGAKNSELMMELERLQAAVGGSDVADGAVAVKRKARTSSPGRTVKPLMSRDTLEGQLLRSAFGGAADEASSGTPAASGRLLASEDWQTLSERLEAELMEVRESSEVTKQELEDRIHELEVELVSQRKFRNLAEAAAADLRVKLEEQAKARTVLTEKLKQLEAALEEQNKSAEKLRKIIHEKMGPHEAGQSAFDVPAGQPQVRELLLMPEPRQKPRQDPQQLDEARREIDRLRARESELEARWVQCAKSNSDILMGCERYRRETQEELSTMRLKLASCSELLNDYVEKMKGKADVEAVLKDELRRANQQMELLRRERNH